MTPTTRNSFHSLAAVALLATAACASAPDPDAAAQPAASAPAARTVTVAPPPPGLPRVVAAAPGERHLTNIRQLTDGGENAEAYFSADGSRIIFQSTRNGRSCDQQYVMNVDGSGLRMVSTGMGKTTCGYFYDDDRRILFSSTHAAGAACPPRPDPSRGYVWGLDPYDIYTARPDGSDLRRLTDWNSYTAEGILSPDGRRIVFTSLKDGDLEIYTMNVDGSDVRRLTNTPGYDGGAWWSPDGSKIVYRAHHPADSAELAEYRALLDQRMIRPSRMEIWIMDADGGNQRQVTRLGGANFSPTFTPDGRRIIFSSNHRNPRSRNFDLYLVDLDGTNLEQVTTDEEFDGFPMFSRDGRYLIWASNRGARVQGETNVFVAEWRE